MTGTLNPSYQENTRGLSAERHIAEAKVLTIDHQGTSEENIEAEEEEINTSNIAESGRLERLEGVRIQTIGPISRSGDIW